MHAGIAAVADSREPCGGLEAPRVLRVDDDHPSAGRSDVRHEAAHELPGDVGGRRQLAVLEVGAVAAVLAAGLPVLLADVLHARSVGDLRGHLRSCSGPRKLPRGPSPECEDAAPRPLKAVEEASTRDQTSQSCDACERIEGSNRKSERLRTHRDLVEEERNLSQREEGEEPLGVGVLERVAERIAVAVPALRQSRDATRYVYGVESSQMGGEVPSMHVVQVSRAPGGIQVIPVQRRKRAAAISKSAKSRTTP